MSRRRGTPPADSLAAPAAALFLSVSLAAAPGAPARAAEPPAAGEETAPVAGRPFAETVDVEVVNVDVYVTDRRGRPVTGLGPEDFRLFEDGEPVTVTNFYEVEGGRRVAGERGSLEGGGEPEAAAPAPVPEALPEPVLLVVYVDHAHLSAFSRNRLLGQLRSFLRRRLEHGDRVMLVGSHVGLDVRQGFTSEWNAVDRGIGLLAGAASSGEAKEVVSRRTLEEVLTYNDLMSSGRFTNSCDSSLDAVAHGYARSVFDEVRATVQTLASFVDSLGGLPGRKALLYVSDGLPLVAGQEVFEVLEQLCGDLATTAEGLAPHIGVVTGGVGGDGGPAGVGGQLDATQWGDFNSVFDAQEYSTAQLFHDLTRRANAQRVAFFTLEARGPRAIPGSSSTAYDQRLSSHRLAFSQAANFQDPLSLMADETGGRAVLDRIDFEPALEGIAADLDTHYSLGYSSPRRGDGRVHTLRVEVRGDGLSVRHRRSFTSKPGNEVFADRVLGTLIFGIEENPLGVEVEVGEPTALDGSLFVVPIRLRIPLGRVVLVPRAGSHEGLLRLQVGARDREGRLAPVRSAEVPISVPDAQLEVARGKVYLYEVKMLMRAGDHAVAVGVRDEPGGTTSFLHLEVPVAGS